MRHHVCSKYGLPILRPPDPELVILKGAVTAGAMLPPYTLPRRARQHYMIDSPRLFIAGDSPEEYRSKTSWFRSARIYLQNCNVQGRTTKASGFEIRILFYRGTSKPDILSQ
jgi:hypothetical protein